MKKKNYLYFIIFVIISCSEDNSKEIIEINPHNLQNLGITESNNIYPLYPNTFQFLGSNQWYDSKVGDTLIISRRDEVTDDSGDELVYKFLIKQGEWIVPLTVKRISNDIYLDPPRYNQLMFNKPIVNFRLQQYIENQTLACEIETPNGDYYLQQPLIDRMWINLDD